MRPDPQHDSLHKLELTISQLLRIGVLVAGVFLLVGWLWLWFNNGDVLSQFSTYEPKTFFESLQWSLITNDKAMLISLLGLAILVCLPLVRVLLTGILFVRQKDNLLAVMAFLVFGALVASFFLGIDL